MSTEVRHNSECSRPELVERAGRFGDQLTGCPECGRWAIIGAAADVPGVRWSPSLPPIPPPPAAGPTGAAWPTHKARRRSRVRRGRK